MKYKIAVTADIHFGYYPAEKLYDEFKLFIETIEKGDIDLAVIAGDYYENKLAMSSKHALYSIKSFNELLDVCARTKTKLRVVRGTASHDPENQLNNFVSMAKTSNCDFKLFNVVDSEDVLPGLKVLYIPEEYMEDSDSYYKDFFENKYNAVFGHGMFEEEMFTHNTKFKTMKKHPVFNSTFFNDELCDGPIVFGHIHKSHFLKSRVLYTGSYTRSKFGEEEAKGFYVTTFDTDTKETEFEFIENEKATKYDTVEIKETSAIFSKLLPEQLQDIKDIVTKFKKDNLRIKIRIPENYINSKPFEDAVLGMYNENKEVNIQILSNKEKVMREESVKKMEILMTKYDFVFDKTIDYDEKIRRFIEVRHGKDIPIERIRTLISGRGK